jgi:hypothetical protein
MLLIHSPQYNFHPSKDLSFRALDGKAFQHYSVQKNYHPIGSTVRRRDESGKEEQYWIFSSHSNADFDDKT